MLYNTPHDAAEYHVINGQAGWMNTASGSPEWRYKFLCALKARLLGWIDQIELEQERMVGTCKFPVSYSVPCCTASSIPGTIKPFLGNEVLQRPHWRNYHDPNLVNQ